METFSFIEFLFIIAYTDCFREAVPSSGTDFPIKRDKNSH